jgi:hypothetical protein
MQSGADFHGAAIFAFILGESGKGRFSARFGRPDSAAGRLSGDWPAAGCGSGETVSG